MYIVEKIADPRKHPGNRTLFDTQNKEGSKIFGKCALVQ
jgi:hypothetical protein